MPAPGSDASLSIGSEAFRNTERAALRGADSSSAPTVISVEEAIVGSENLSSLDLQADASGDLLVTPMARRFPALQWSGSGYSGLLAGSTVHYSSQGVRGWGVLFGAGIPSCAGCGASDRMAFSERPDYPRVPGYDFGQRINALKVSAAGDVYFGGIMAGTEEMPASAIRGGGALVGKLDSAGMLVWFDQVPCDGEQEAYVSWLGLGPDDSVLAFGRCAGRMPGQAREASGGPFVIRYSSVGERLWARQYVPTDFAFGDGDPDRFLRSPFVASPDGTLYVPVLGTASTWGSTYAVRPGTLSPVLAALRAIDAGGTLGDRLLWRASGVGLQEEYAPEPVIAPGGDAYYAVGTVAALAWEARQAGMADPSNSQRRYLIREALDGSESWTRGFDVPEQSGQGAISTVRRLVASEDALYLLGTTDRSPRHYFVMRLDLEGERVWFREFSLPVGHTPQYDWSPAISLGPPGRLALVFASHTLTHVFNAVHLLWLDLADGSSR